MLLVYPVPAHCSYLCLLFCLKQAELVQQDSSEQPPGPVFTTEELVPSTSTQKPGPVFTTAQLVPSTSTQKPGPALTMAEQLAEQLVPSTSTQKPGPALTMAEQLVPSTSMQQPGPSQQQTTSKRKSFFNKVNNQKYAKLSNAHSQITSMAQSKCSQIDEQLNLMKARDEREKELHKWNIQKLQREVDVLNAKEAYIKDKQRREAEAHEIDMHIKEFQLKLVKKQLQ